MKKIMFAAMIVLGTISFSACENKSNTTDTEMDETTVETDTSSTTGTVMESDTTNSTGN